MPNTLRYNEHILIKGLGLDELLEPGRGVLIVDNFYADYYGDYIFLGYDVYVAVPRIERGDTLGLFNAAALLDRGPMVIVCGDEPEQCLYTIAAHEALHGRDPAEALDEAIERLHGFYGKEPQRSRPAEEALKALHKVGRLLGPDRFAAITGVGDSYNYGWGPLHYGETLAWLAELEASDEALAAASLHFLLEGPGEPQRLLELRLEALTLGALRELLGGLADKALKTLRDYAAGRLEGAAAELALVEKLGPGEGPVLYPERRGDTLLVHCAVDSEGAPAAGCVERVGEAARLLEQVGPIAGVARVRLAAGPQGSL